VHDRRVARGTPHTEEMIRYDFHPIRNMKITYMGVPMGILGMAAAWYAIINSSTPLPVFCP
jgi:hypothetical protein